MPATPTLTLCDALVTALDTAWTGKGADDGVERHYFKRFADGEDPNLKLLGRRVVIFPTGYDNSPADRGEDGYQHRVSVLTVERYTAAGDPTRAWIDDRVDFVFTYVVQGFDFSRGPPSWNRVLATLSADVQVCDTEKLTSAGKLFFALVDLVFLELVDA